jgi:hypothetical protein
MMRVLALCLATLAAAAAGDLHWMISISAVRHLREADPSGTLDRRFFADPGSFVMNGAKGAEGFPQGWRALPTATFPSYAVLAKALEGGQLPAEVKAIIYDNESWTFTPPEEQHDLERFEKLAADAIHGAGRILIATPAADLVPVLSPQIERGKRYDEYLRLGIARMAARWADVYEVQAQGSEDNLPLYTRFVKGAAAAAREANPKVRVFAGLSTNPSGKRVTAKQLYDAVEATRGAVDGYWLNIPGGGAYCPKCGEPQPQVAVDLLRMLDERQAKPGSVVQ